MHVDIIDFPETLVAALEHHGPENQTYKTSIKFIQWRKENGVPADKGPTTTNPQEHSYISITLALALQVGPYHPC